MTAVRRELERVEIAGEHEARVRAWEVARAAWAAREPVPRTRSFRPLLVAAAVAAVVAAALSPPGQAVLDSIREVVGVERAEPALFSLPTRGQLLVESDEGAWVVHADGAKRRLGPYDDAAWSPFGRYVAATHGNELRALEPDGDIRWTIARRVVNSPAWGGTARDTRIGYLSENTLRVVSGDGTDDRFLAAAVSSTTPLAWKPGGEHVLAYGDVFGRVRVVETDSKRVLWSVRRSSPPRHLEWSRDATRLLVVWGETVDVFRADGRRVGTRALRSPASAAAFAPRGHRFALAQREPRADLATLTILDADRLDAPPRRVFMGSGIFDAVLWSPDGRWLLVSWPNADQWVFLGFGTAGEVEAVGEITRQFGGRRPPTLAGWCCPAAP